jgi:hypothetical protein
MTRTAATVCVSGCILAAAVAFCAVLRAAGTPALAASPQAQRPAAQEAQSVLRQPCADATFTTTTPGKGYTVDEAIAKASADGRLAAQAVCASGGCATAKGVRYVNVQLIQNGQYEVTIEWTCGH